MKPHNVSKNRSTVQMVSIASLLAVAGACAPSAPGSREVETEVVRSPLVGFGTDFVASVSGTLSQVVGSFPVVIGVTSETGTDGASDEYSLQVNSNTFSTPACTGGLPGCIGWRQFIYSSRQGGAVYIETYLKRFGSTASPRTCPPDFGGVVTTADCGRRSTPVSVTTQVISKLSGLSLTAQAVAGGNDTVILSLGGIELARSMDPDNVDNLGFAANWNQAEFNIFGDTSASPQAIFNPPTGNGVAIGVQLAVTGSSSAAPTCTQIGTTAETNNMILVPGTCTPVGGVPAKINFFESSTGTMAPYIAPILVALNGSVF